jgi:hypothetical protein
LPGPLTCGHGWICDFDHRPRSSASETGALLGADEVPHSATFDDNFFTAFRSIEHIRQTLANL